MLTLFFLKIRSKYKLYLQIITFNKNSMKQTLSKAVVTIEEFYKLKYCSTVVYMVPRA